MKRWKTFWETSIQSLREQRRVWFGLYMRPMRKMERRLTLSGTSVTSDNQINLKRWRRRWHGWSCITRIKLPLSGTMLLLLTKYFLILCFLNWWATKIVAGDYASSLGESVKTSLSRRKIPNDDSSCTSAMANDFVRRKSYGPNHTHQV